MFRSLIFGSRHRPPSSLPVVRGYQIFYNDSTREAVDPEFEGLSNIGSERADWFEYWPIRRFFEVNQVDESTLYGFVSPKFGMKTGLSGADVMSFIESCADADVVLFSPFPDHSAVFLNVFEQGWVFDPLTLDVAVEFFRAHDSRFDVREMVNYSGSAVFCNFIFAKPVFWREWLSVCGDLCLASERGALSSVLCETLSYKDVLGFPKPVQRKIFVMERVASVILARSSCYNVSSYPISCMPMSTSSAVVAKQLYQMDELKRLYIKEGSVTALKDFVEMQRDVVCKVVSPGESYIFEGFGSELLRR